MGAALGAGELSCKQGQVGGGVLHLPPTVGPREGYPSTLNLNFFLRKLEAKPTSLGFCREEGFI